VTERSLTIQIVEIRRKILLNKKDSVSGEVHGNFVACLILGRGSSPQP
jgi:hypothetical protein